MPDTDSKTGFITDAFIGALEKNDEVNKGIVKEKESAPAGNEAKEGFTTDAFCEALKINEEVNKK